MSRKLKRISSDQDASSLSHAIASRQFPGLSLIDAPSRFGGAVIRLGRGEAAKATVGVVGGGVPSRGCVFSSAPRAPLSPKTAKPRLKPSLVACGSSWGLPGARVGLPRRTCAGDVRFWPEKRNSADAEPKVQMAWKG